MNPETQRNLSRLQTISQVGTEIIQEAQPHRAYLKEKLCKDRLSKTEEYKVDTVRTKLETYAEFAEKLSDIACELVGYLSNIRLSTDVQNQFNAFQRGVPALREEARTIFKVTIPEVGSR